MMAAVVRLFLFLAGDGATLHTISLRIGALYGEEDVRHKKMLEESGYKMNRIGRRDSALDVNYAGNVAWAHVASIRALTKNPEIGGHFYYINDDLPSINRFDFAEALLPDVTVSKFSVPYFLIFFIFSLIKIALYVISPLYKGNFPLSEQFLYYYKHQFSYNRGKAERELGYMPIYTYEEGARRSQKYYGKS